MKKKTSKIEFKLEEDLFVNYKQYCDQNGFDMSKRLRLFIQSELSDKPTVFNMHLFKIDNDNEK